MTLKSSASLQWEIGAKHGWACRHSRCGCTQVTWLVLKRPCLSLPLPPSDSLHTQNSTQNNKPAIKMCFKKVCEFLSSSVPVRRPATPLNYSTFYTHPNTPLEPSSSPAGGQDQHNSQGKSMICMFQILRPKLITKQSLRKILSMRLQRLVARAQSVQSMGVRKSPLVLQHQLLVKEWQLPRLLRSLLGAPVRLPLLHQHRLRLSAALPCLILMPHHQTRAVRLITHTSNFDITHAFYPPVPLGRSSLLTTARGRTNTVGRALL